MSAEHCLIAEIRLAVFVCMQMCQTVQAFNKIIWQLSLRMQTHSLSIYAHLLPQKNKQKKMCEAKELKNKN